jgi:hypothetical protein
MVLALGGVQNVPNPTSADSLQLLSPWQYTCSQYCRLLPGYNCPRYTLSGKKWGWKRSRPRAIYDKAMEIT